jgi:hypothetical protein
VESGRFEACVHLELGGSHHSSGWWSDSKYEDWMCQTWNDKFKCRGRLGLYDMNNESWETTWRFHQENGGFKKGHHRHILNLERGKSGEMTIIHWPVI